MKQRKSRCPLSAGLILLVIWAGHRTAVEAADYTAAWDSLKTAPVPAWFDDAKFGIFIHWGAYSVAGYTPRGRGYAEHFPKNIYRAPETHYPFLKATFGKQPPDFGYKDIIPLFKAERWDPDDWAELFRKAGARYVILTGEHHDGYALWDSSLTEWCATKIGPKRDLVGDLAKAVRARGMKFAPSYHRERHPGFFAKDLYAPVSQPQTDVAEEIRRQPDALDLYGPFDYNDAFIAGYVARWKELERKYRPDFMWVDDIPIFYHAPDHPQTKKLQDACRVMIANYLNAARSWGKELYLNNKGAHLNWPEGVGCREKDNLHLETIGPKWQNPATLGTSYGYLKAEDEHDAYKSPAELIHLLCDVVSKNGNLLLNIGPRSDGAIPDGMRRRLLALGEWLSVNGEAIYGTRPWLAYGEGPNLLSGAGKLAGPVKYNDRNIRYTCSKDGHTLYAIAVSWPQAKFSPTILQVDDAIGGRVELIGHPDKLRFKVEGKRLTVDVPSKPPCQHAYAFKLTGFKTSLTPAATQAREAASKQLQTKSIDPGKAESKKREKRL